jgi:glycosyltransferase involved in cell wall biosynthesis
MRLRWLSGQLLLAPRGELSLGALGLKAMRKRLYLAGLRRLLRDVDWQASSADEAGDIKRYVPRARVHISADDRPLTPPQPRTRATPSSPLEIVTVARITRMKNLEASIRSLSLCEAPAILRLYGPISEPNYWKQCQSLIRTLPARVDVLHMGSVAHHEVQRVLGEADVFLLPTQGENFGQAIAEALAAGCPVVISDRTPWTKLIRSKRAGSVHLPDDYAGMAAALDGFAEYSAESMARSRAAARSAYEASFIELPASLGNVLKDMTRRRLA